MGPKAGWHILREDGLTATRSPSPFPIANYVWGEATPAHLRTCGGFFGKGPFHWLLEEGQDASVLLGAGFTEADPTPEMIFTLQGTRFPEPPPGIRVVQAWQDLDACADLLRDGFGFPKDQVLAFYGPLIASGVITPFLASVEGEPAATALAFTGRTGTGLYSIATSNRFRRRGAGTAVTRACLRAARIAGAELAVLYSSAMGRPLYEQIGFTTAQVLREFHAP